MTSLIHNAFTETRKPGDPDYVEAVTKTLREANHPQPEAWLDAKDVKEAIGEAPKRQRFLIGRHFCQKLAEVEDSTTTERFFLNKIVDAPISEYLDVFRKAILPTVVKHAL